VKFNIYRVHKVVSELPAFQFILLLSLVAFIGKIFPAIFYVTLFNIDEPLGSYNASDIDWVLGLLIAPIVETLVFQMAPILILKKYTRLKSLYIILISAAIFAACHTFSIAYIILTFVLGACLAYSYVIYLNKSVSAFRVTASIHALHNLFAWALVLL